MKKNTIKKVNKKTKRGKYSKKQIKTKRFRRKGMIRKMNNISRKKKSMWITEGGVGSKSKVAPMTVADRGGGCESDEGVAAGG